MNSDRVAVLFGPHENPRKKSDKNLTTIASDKPVSTLTQQYAPLPDFRGREVLYHQVRHGLMAEFPVATFGQQAEIDSLAQDYLWLAHYRRIWEEAARPRVTLTPEEEVTWKRYQAAQSVLPVITRMVTHKNLTPPCTREEAREVAAPRQ